MQTITCNKSERVLYTAAEVAEVFSVEPRTVRNWCDDGLIPVALRTGKTIRFNLDHVTQALNEETGKAQREKMKRSRARRSALRDHTSVTPTQAA